MKSCQDSFPFAFWSFVNSSSVKVSFIVFIFGFLLIYLLSKYVYVFKFSRVLLIFEYVFGLFLKSFFQVPYDGGGWKKDLG